MARTEHYFTKFEENNFYHIYNRTVDRKPMFKNEGNYVYFLIKYNKYLLHVIDTFAYGLLGNHFHILMYVPSLTTFKAVSNLKTQKTTHEIVSHQFQLFFQSYAMSFNKQQNRIGTLFQTPFKRALVDNKEYLIKLIYYIHANPQLHGLIKDFRGWNWSSYHRLLIEKPDNLKKREVLELFGGKEEFIKFHLEKQKMITDERYVLEGT